VSQTLDTCREKCRKLRHSRIASWVQKAERTCLQSVAVFSVAARFWQGPCTLCRRPRRADLLRRLYVQQGEAMSTSTPTPVRSLPTVPAQRFRLPAASTTFGNHPQFLPAGEGRK
jgi:hypothetical protein